MSAALESETPCTAATEQRAFVVTGSAIDGDEASTARRELQDELWSTIAATYQVEALGQAIATALDEWTPRPDEQPYVVRARHTATHLADLVQAQTNLIADRLTKLEMAVRNV